MYSVFALIPGSTVVISYQVLLDTKLVSCQIPLIMKLAQLNHGLARIQNFHFFRLGAIF